MRLSDSVRIASGLRAFAPVAALAAAVLIVLPSTPSFSADEGAEGRAAAALDKVRDNPLLLHDFLKRMPKGGDLHVHLSGAVYAESFLNAAAEDGLCVDVANKAFSKSQPIAAGAEPGPVCEQGDVAAKTVPKNQPLYDALVDSFSMRGFVPSEGVTGHDHFFGTFAKFGGTHESHLGTWLDEVTNRAAKQNVQYLELMETPTWNLLNTIAKDMAWRADFASMRDELLAKGLANDVPAAKAFWDRAEAEWREKAKCGTAEASSGCKVETRYIYEVFRNTPKELVFAQTLFGFELAAADPRVAAINLVAAEDGYVAMADYADHMRIVGFLRGLYPDVKVSLHAGELAPGLVPPEGLCCHVRQAVETAKADRIGHGVDVMYEDRPQELLKSMAEKRVLVEVPLTSNDLILGVKGKHHPFALYREAGVPVALSTDDPGIARITLTHEFVRAVQEFGLSYADLKELVRNSLEYSFLRGASLWSDGTFTAMAGACQGADTGAPEPPQGCAAVLDGSQKAAQQWELEKRFAAFEQSH